MSSPVTCYCGSPMLLRMGKYRLEYVCRRTPMCDGMISADPCGNPRGMPADSHTRHLRQMVHALLDKEWLGADRRGRYERRTAAYQRLSFMMGLSAEECHVGLFDAKQCRQAIAHLRNHERNWRGQNALTAGEESLLRWMDRVCGA